MEFVQPGEGMMDGIVTSILFKGVHYEMKVQAKGFEWLAHSTIAYQPGTEIGLYVNRKISRLCTNRRLPHRRLSKRMNKRSLLATPYIIWIIGFTVLPILMIIFYALRDGNGGFTMVNILAIFQPVHLKALLMSLWLALLCTAVCLVLAYPLAIILRKLNIGKQGMMAIIVILPMWVNFVLRIMAWQLLLSRNGIINAILGAFGLPGQDLANSNVAIVIGMVYDYLPFMILPVYNAVTELNEDILEAARDLGAPPKAVTDKNHDPVDNAGNH